MAAQQDFSFFDLFVNVVAEYEGLREYERLAEEFAKNNSPIRNREKLEDALNHACRCLEDESLAAAIRAAKRVWKRQNEDKEATERSEAAHAEKCERLNRLVQWHNPKMWETILYQFCVGEFEGRAKELNEALRNPLKFVTEAGSRISQWSGKRVWDGDTYHRNLDRAIEYFWRWRNLYPQFDVERQPASKANMATEAKAYLEERKIHSLPTLRYWSGAFWQWSSGRYAELPTSEANALAVNCLNEKFDNVGANHRANFVEQLKAKSIVPSTQKLNTWLTDHPWQAEDVFACKNMIIHLPSYRPGGNRWYYAQDPTPAFFATSAADYDFLHYRTRLNCPEWLKFLKQLWPSDPQSIQMLQEWFGYCLTADTRQQKMLLVLGPKRSGKGTIMRMLTSVIGQQNVCSPTLASLQQPFGMASLLGKSVAIINDARLSGKSDQAIITERLLSISGEDTQTVERKFMEAVTTKLNTRFTIVSNEMPKLQDQSGALPGRMLILKLDHSFYGNEDKSLSDRLLNERDGILRWAIAGWQRLRKRGCFVQPKSSSDVADQLKELSSPVSVFVDECCVIGADCESPTADVYTAWCEWCSKCGNHAGNAATFGRDLASQLPSLRRRQMRLGAHRVWIYSGIRLN